MLPVPSDSNCFFIQIRPSTIMLGPEAVLWHVSKPEKHHSNPKTAVAPTTINRLLGPHASICQHSAGICRRVRAMSILYSVLHSIQCSILCSTLCSILCSTLCGTLYSVIYSLIHSLIHSILCSILYSMLCSML